jgi:hypothetical protein
MQVRLTYKRRRLIISAILFWGVGLGGFMLSMSPLHSRRGIVGLAIAIFGPQGAQLFLAAISVLIVLGAIRVIWLSFDNALAAEIERRGIRLRSVYYSGLLPWEAITSISLRDVRGWGKHPVLVVDHTDEAHVLLRLVGQGSKIILSPKLLNADDDRLDDWIDAAIEATNNRGPSYRPERRGAPMVQQPTMQHRPVFGKRR